MVGPTKMVRAGKYDAIIKHVFASHYVKGAKAVHFDRDDIVKAAAALGLQPPKNLGDVMYSFRYRKVLPEEIAGKAPKGMEWTIRAIGEARYRFELTTPSRIVPNQLLAESRLPDATPGVVAMYIKGDEQALLARLRYNRLLDVFTGMACYSLQSHLRTQVEGMGQGEVDELYVGIDRRGAHYVLPVQAKGGRDQISLVQTEQDVRICLKLFPDLACKPIAAQFMQSGLIAMFEFELTSTGRVALLRERHYRLVAPEDLTPEELASYAQRLD